MRCLFNLIFSFSCDILVHMSKVAVIETGGKQYKVKEGDKIKVEKLDGEAGKTVFFEKVLLGADEKNVKVGKPYLEGAKIEGQLLQTKKDKKKVVFKYHSKTRYRKLKGHRQLYSEVLIQKISF